MCVLTNISRSGRSIFERLIVRPAELGLSNIWSTSSYILCAMSALSDMGVTEDVSWTNCFLNRGPQIVQVGSFCRAVGLRSSVRDHCCLQCPPVRRFDLSTDFATFNQAAWLISHGNLNPWSSIHSYPFLNDHLALIMYPVYHCYIWIVHTGALSSCGFKMPLESPLNWWLSFGSASRSSSTTHHRVSGLGFLRQPYGCLSDHAGQSLVCVAMFFDSHPRPSPLSSWCSRHGPRRRPFGLAGARMGCSAIALRRSRWPLPLRPRTVLVDRHPETMVVGSRQTLIGYGWIRFADALGVNKNSFLTLYSYIQTGSPTVGDGVDHLTVGRHAGPPAQVAEHIVGPQETHLPELDSYRCPGCCITLVSRHHVDSDCELCAHLPARLLAIRFPRICRPTSSASAGPFSSCAGWAVRSAGTPESPPWSLAW